MAKICGILISVIGTGLFVTITIYLGIYAYKNPDPTSCWAVRDMDSTAKTKELAILKAVEMGIDVTEGYPMEMHRVFLAWFIWGFWAKVTLVALGLLTFGV